jgi:hypothetical protein
MSTALNLDVTPGTIVYIDPNLLTPHPNNTQIYGEEDVTDLAQSIAESGWMKPLTINTENVVIAGHRRRQAGIKLGWAKVPVIIEMFASPEAEMERLLRENENRDKTSEQQIREGMTWEPIEEAKAKKRRSVPGNQYTGKNGVPKKFTGDQIGETRDIIARRVGLGSGVTYEKGKEVVSYMDDMLATNTERGSILRMNLNDDSITSAYKAMKKYMQLDEEAERRREREEVDRLRKQEEARQRYLEAAKKAEHCTLYHCPVANLSQYIQPDCIDTIITDPPYPREFLPVYSDLAEFAAYALKPGGSLVVMSGQSYLQEVMERLSSAGLTYQWTCAYMTPAPATQVHQGHAQSQWKPLLWYTKGKYSGMYVYDVFRSDMIDKTKHHWGQSESGIAAIMERFSRTNDLVCDPFVGGGTTAVVAMEMERRFIGCDVDESCVMSLEERKKKVLEEAGRGL